MFQKFSPLREITRPHLSTPIVMIPRRSFGALGLLVGQAATNASQATKSLSDVGTGVTIGATIGSAILPGPGTAIGAAVGAIAGAIGSLFGPAKEGQAAETWDDMTAHDYLYNTRGQAFDERYIGEAYKGAMDKGTDIWPACGSAGYTNPDCFYSALAHVIANGYLNKVVPLSATTAQVYANVVQPWLMNGASGLFNWPAAKAEQQSQGTALSQQELLIQAATDRYIGGLPITRANMPSYASEAASYSQWSTPSITTLLANLLHPPAAAATPAPAAVALAAKTPGAGQGYNYFSQIVSVPPYYTVNSSGHIVDWKGFILGSPNDNAMVAANQIKPPSSTPVATVAVSTPSSPAVLAPGMGYNYAGLAVPIPTGYTLNSQGYIIDSSGYIFGSANDDALTAPAQNTPSALPTNYPPSYGGIAPVAAPTASSAAPADNTWMYLLAGLGALWYVTKGQKK